MRQEYVAVCLLAFHRFHPVWPDWKNFESFWWKVFSHEWPKCFKTFCDILKTSNLKWKLPLLLSGQLFEEMGVLLFQHLVTLVPSIFWRDETEGNVNNCLPPRSGFLFASGLTTKTIKLLIHLRLVFLAGKQLRHRDTSITSQTQSLWIMITTLVFES